MVVAMVALVASTVALFLLTGQSGSFGEILNNNTNNANCELLKTRFKNSVSCDGGEITKNANMQLRLESECNQPPNIECEDGSAQVSFGEDESFDDDGSHTSDPDGVQ